MIDLYAWGTTNGRRALIMVEESGLPFKLHQIDIRNGVQNTDAYEKLNPYRKIPALVDHEGPGEKPATVFESVAICFYLAEKVGRFLGSPADHPNVLKWSMFHATNVLSTLGNLRQGDNAKLEKSANRSARCHEQTSRWSRLVCRGLFRRRHHTLHASQGTRPRTREGCRLSERGGVARSGRLAAGREDSHGSEIRLRLASMQENGAPWPPGGALAHISTGISNRRAGSNCDRSPLLR